jgi:hypothetical protein
VWLVFGIACIAFRMASPHDFLTSVIWKSNGAADFKTY